MVVLDVSMDHHAVATERSLARLGMTIALGMAIPLSHESG